jgi:aryl-alcohol dehydrogenase-like predicted oxidoreductase
VRYTHVGGARLSVIGLGTWQFGSREWRYGHDYATREAVAITRRALDLGVNLLDTAEIYGFGRSERIVGRAIAGRRGQAFLATKLYPALPAAPIVVHRGVRSARRLGVRRLDLYQVHAHNPAIPVSSTMRGMAHLRRSGFVDHVGVSNFSLSQWQEAEHALGSPVLSNQVRYSLATRIVERDVVPWAQANDRLIIAYSPLGQGFLTGSYSKGNTPADVRRRNPLFLDSSLDKATELIATVRAVGARHGATAAQVALAWLVRRPNVVAIPGARNVAQLEENVAAADLVLSDEEDQWLTSVSHEFRPRADRLAP